MDKQPSVVDSDYLSDNSAHILRDPIPVESSDLVICHLPDNDDITKKIFSELPYWLLILPSHGGVNVLRQISD